MPSQKFALEAGGPQNVEVSWKAFWKDIEVRVDGSLVGAMANQSELSQGKGFMLSDGTNLHVQLISGISPELRLSRNGKPLPGSSADPVQRVKTASGVLYFIGALSIILGLVAAVFQIEILVQFGFGFISAASGLIFVVLGYFVAQRSSVALIIAIILYAADGILGVGTALASGNFAFGGILARIILLVPLVQAVGAIRELNEKPAAAV